MKKNSCQLQVRQEGEVLVASLTGELDHHGAVAVRALIDSEISRLTPKKTVLDLSALDFMDSSGLGLIMGRYALMQRVGGEFSVKDPNERILKIFRLAGLDRMIKVEREGKEKKNETKRK